MRRTIGRLAVAAAAAAVILTAPGLAAKGPPVGSGSGGSGGEETTLGNNLSVPAIFVGDTTGAPVLRLPCGTAQEPGWDGRPASTEYPGYWLQKTEATWTADCTTAASIDGVVADWGDNLVAAGQLTVSKPLRVELGLLAPSVTGMRGFTVEKLNDVEDRLATYGTKPGLAFTAGRDDAAPTRIWDPGVTLTIEQLDANGDPIAPAVYTGPMTAEINSSGAVVYGYNWGSKGQPPAAGTYLVAATVSQLTTIAGIADTGALRVPTFGDHSTEFVVTLGGARDNGAGGESGETGLGNNLSVPAVLVPSATAAGAPALRLPCGDAQDPTGSTSSEPAYLGYWLQNTEATWTAQCTAESSIGGVTADWSDALTAPEESLTGGRPLRIELGLLVERGGMKGYVVENLTPSLDDRDAVYGTKGDTFETGGADVPARVWDAGGHLTITPLVNGVAGTPVYDGPLSSQVDSSGKILYGYTWGGEGGRVNAPAAGTYRLEFTTSAATTLSGVADTADTGAVNVPTSTAHSTTLVITLAGAAGRAPVEGGRPAGNGSGGGEETTLGNNLSVPAILVGNTAGAPALRIPCGEALDPGSDGRPASTEYPGYWLQKTEATWTATCSTAGSASVVADWGDNLTAAPSTAAGKPVRVEVGLLAPSVTGMRGFTVEKLNDVEDRLATYGTNPGLAFVAGAGGATPARVWDPGVTLTIEQLDASGNPIGPALFSGSMTAEINSTGAIVYGYNWGSKGQPPAAGTYRLTIVTSDLTTITGVADTGNVPGYTAHSTSLTVTLGSGGGGSGGGGGSSGGGSGGSGSGDRAAGGGSSGSSGSATGGSHEGSTTVADSESSTAGGGHEGTTAGGSPDGTTAGGGHEGTTAGGSPDGTTAGGGHEGSTTGGSPDGTTAGGGHEGSTTGGSHEGSAGAGRGQGGSSGSGAHGGGGPGGRHG